MKLRIYFLNGGNGVDISFLLYLVNFWFENFFNVWFNVCLEYGKKVDFKFVYIIFSMCILKREIKIMFLGWMVEDIFKLY